MRFYDAERPRSVVVGWDTLEAPNWRILEFPTYQGGRKFDDELLEQLDVLPVFVHACGFVVGKAAGTRPTTSLPPPWRLGEKRGWTTLVASGDRDTFQLASELTTILYPVKAGEIARIGSEQVRERYGVEPHQVPDFIAPGRSLRQNSGCAGDRSANCG
ncbi:MAG: hypothetical protein H0T56_00110 [Pseudaminobacter sp.]|nr:hypothetical protein [Pseudaminobacter sp.]